MLAAAVGPDLLPGLAAPTLPDVVVAVAAAAPCWADSSFPSFSMPAAPVAARVATAAEVARGRP